MSAIWNNLQGRICAISGLQPAVAIHYPIVIKPIPEYLIWKLSVLLNLFIAWKLDSLRFINSLEEIFGVRIIKTCPDETVT